MSLTKFIKIDDQHASLSGQLDFVSVIRLQEDGRQLINEMSAVILDCSDVEKSGSPGIALVLAYARICRSQKKQISVINLPDHMSAIAEVYGITQFLELNNG